MKRVNSKEFYTVPKNSEGMCYFGGMEAAK